MAKLTADELRKRANRIDAKTLIGAARELLAECKDADAAKGLREAADLLDPQPEPEARAS